VEEGVGVEPSMVRDLVQHAREQGLLDHLDHRMRELAQIMNLWMCPNGWDASRSSSSDASDER
jgi:hypothetical protein